MLSFPGRVNGIIKCRLVKKQCDNPEKFLHFQFGNEWLLQRKGSNEFMGSENIRKYLKMKTKDGKIVPMNDATFEKYNKQINLKD